MLDAHQAVRKTLAGETIWLWHYLHADWQWEQSRQWHEDRYILAMTEVLDAMNDGCGLTYVLDSVNEFMEPVMLGLGCRVDELRDRVREGRIEPGGGTMTNSRPNQVGDETFIRNLAMGRSWFEEHLGVDNLRLFHCVDVALGHSQMPQILRQSGYDYYRAWRPSEPLNAGGIPHQFRWQGADGTEIVVTRGSYGGMYMSDGAPVAPLGAWPWVVSQFFDGTLKEQVIAGRSPSGHLWATQGCDDGRPFRTWDGDQLVDLNALVEHWNQEETSQLRWGLPSAFSEAVASGAEKLPVVSGVLDECDCSYNLANAGALGLWRWRQSNDAALVEAERWLAMAALAGREIHDADLAPLWRDHLRYQAHAQEFAFAPDLEKLIDVAAQVRSRALAYQRQAQENMVAGSYDRHTYFVGNINPWPVEADVEIYHACAVPGSNSVRLTDGDKEIEHQIVGQLRHPRFAGSLNDVRVVARVQVPAMGYRRLTVAELGRGSVGTADPPAELDETVDTGTLAITMHGDFVQRVTDTSNGRQLLGGGAAQPCLIPAFHVVPDQDWTFSGKETGVDLYQPDHGQWLEAGPMRWRHRSTGRVGPFAAEFQIILYRDRSEVETHLTVEGHWDQPEVTGYLALETRLEPGGELTVDVPFGIEPRHPDENVYADPDRDVNYFERTIPGLFWARSWVDWRADGHGVTMFSADGPNYWLRRGDTLAQALVRCQLRRPGTWQDRTHPQLGGAGVHTFRHVIRFSDGALSRTEIVRRAAELRHPIRVFRSLNGGVPAPPPDASFLSVSGAQLSTCYRQGSGIVARLFEVASQHTSASITLARAVRSAKAVDLAGRPLDVPVRWDGNVVTLGMAPCQIVTIELELEPDVTPCE